MMDIQSPSGMSNTILKGGLAVALGSKRLRVPILLVFSAVLMLGLAALFVM